MRFETKLMLRLVAGIIVMMALWTTALYLGHPEYFHKQPAPVEDTDVFQNMRGDK